MAKSPPFKGRCRIGAYSGVRKLARAMRRGTVPPEQRLTIELAQRSAAERPGAWLSSHARMMRELFA